MVFRWVVSISKGMETHSGLEHAAITLHIELLQSNDITPARDQRH